MIKLTYAGKDITKDVSVNRCVHDMYAEKKSDTLYLIVNDINSIWDTWQPQNGDEISVDYGAIGTGKMYIYQCSPVNGRYIIKAMSAPPDFRSVNNKAWQKVRLLQIGEEIASRHGLTFKQYNVTDQTYNFILQSNQDDFSFLHQRCILEGCAFLVHDGCLTMYNQSIMENMSPDKYLNLSMDADYEYKDTSSSGYGSCEIERGSYNGSYNAGNGLSAVLRPTDEIYIGSSAEASRFAKNMLREANKNCLTGYVRGNVMTGYAAGSCAALKNPRAPSWDGVVFLTHVRNDYMNCWSKIFFRKPLGGY